MDEQDRLASAKADAGMYEHEDEDPNHGDPYIELADANPERVNNGCMVYRRDA